MGERWPRPECRRTELYQPSVSLKHAMRASACDVNRRKPLTPCCGRITQALRRLVEPGLAALVAVVDDVLRPALADHHLHRVQHQLGPQVVRHRPADNLRLTLRVWLAAQACPPINALRCQMANLHGFVVTGPSRPLRCPLPSMQGFGLLLARRRSSRTCIRRRTCTPTQSTDHQWLSEVPASSPDRASHPVRSRKRRRRACSGSAAWFAPWPSRDG